MQVKKMLTLKMLRNKAKQTQADVAKSIGVDRTTYAKYESGASEPSIEMLQRMAKHYNVSVGYIMGEPGSADGGDYVRIPVLGSVPAGIPLEAIEDIIDYEEIPQSLCPAARSISRWKSRATVCGRTISLATW